MNKCKICKFRGINGYCDNPKLAEDIGQSESKRKDMLIYDYNEGGSFWVGPEFGCIHYEK